MMPYYMLRTPVPEGRGLRENTVYRGSKSGSFHVRLDVSRGVSVDVRLDDVRTVYLAGDGVPVSVLTPDPVIKPQAYDESIGSKRFIVFKLVDGAVHYDAYKDALEHAKKLAAGYAKTTFRVARVLADVEPPSHEATVRLY